MDSYIYFILQFIIQYYVIYFVAEIFQALAIGSSCGLVPVSLRHDLILLFIYVLQHCLSSW